jgi:hypothetical protein
MCQDVDVCEVPCGSPVKQGEQLVGSEFFRSKRRSGPSRGGRKVRRRVHGQVNQDPGISTADDHPAKRVAVMDPLRGPASLTGSGLQGIASGKDMPVIEGGEEVEVFSGPCCQVLREQGCSPLPARSPDWQAGRRTAWPPPAGKPKGPASCRPPSLRLGLARKRDQWSPRGPDAPWQDKVFPQVYEQHTVNVSKDVGGRSFLQHDLVHARPVGT